MLVGGSWNSIAFTGFVSSHSMAVNDFISPHFFFDYRDNNKTQHEMQETCMTEMGTMLWPQSLSDCCTSISFVLFSFPHFSTMWCIKKRTIKAEGERTVSTWIGLLLSVFELKANHRHWSCFLVWVLDIFACREIQDLCAIFLHVRRYNYIEAYN